MGMNILFVCNRPGFEQDASTIREHIDAFRKYSVHNIWLYSGVGKFPESLDLELFDVIIIHYSMYVPWNNYLDLESKEKIRKFDGLKVIFIQDEYRRIDLMIDTLNFLKIDVLFTCFPEHELHKEEHALIIIY